jgi:hypothetical protein
LIRERSSRSEASQRGGTVSQARGRLVVKVITADYFCDHVAHVCMAPMNATAAVNGDQVETSNQSPSDMKEIGARRRHHQG